MKSTLNSQKIPLENGETINVHVRGQGSNILIAVHGIWTDHRCFSPLFPYLENDFTIVGIDLRGQGESTLFGRIDNIDLYVEDISLVLKHFGIQKCSLIGWSLGSIVSVRYAIFNPDIVDNLFLIAPLALTGMPCFKDEKLYTFKEELYDDEYYASTIESIRTKNLELAKKNLLEDSFESDHPPDPVQLDELADQILKTKNVIDIRWAAFKYNFLEEEKWDLKGDGSIKRLKAKVYIFFGEKDVLAPPSVLSEYIEALGEQVTIEKFNTAHGLHYIYPKEISALIIEVYSKSKLEKNE